MTRYEYDEEASEHFHMDVVYEVDDRPTPVARWVEAMRRLNGITDPLGRKIVELHRACGTGEGECDGDMDPVPIPSRRDWGCQTTALVADHFGVEYPSTQQDG